jgi:hypothetical protein
VCGTSCCQINGNANYFTLVVRPLYTTDIMNDVTLGVMLLMTRCTVRYTIAVKFVRSLRLSYYPNSFL